MTSETLADVVAEMRELAADIEAGNAVVGQTVWRNYADRIEAAWRCEREEVDERIMIEKSKSAGEGYADGYADGVDKVGTVNAAAMREAAVTAYDALDKLKSFSLQLGDVRRMREFSRLVCLAKNRLDAALAEPARNCDVPHKDGHELWVRWQNDCIETFPSMVSFSKWLLAPAQEGGAK